MMSDIDKLALRLGEALENALRQYPSGAAHKTLLRMQKDLGKQHFMFREMVWKGRHEIAKKHALEILGLARRYEEMITPQKPLTIDLKLDWM